MNLMDHMQLRAAQGRMSTLVVRVATDDERRVKTERAKYYRRRERAEAAGLCKRCECRPCPKGTTCSECRADARERMRRCREKKRRANGGT